MHTPEMKERLRKTVLKYLAVLGIGIAYLIFVLCTDMGIPCPLYSITGLQCPACGVSRMIIALVRLDVAAAFSYNPFIMITGPVILAYIVCYEVRFIRSGDGSMGKWDILLWVLSGAAIVFGVLRNIF